MSAAPFCRTCGALMSAGSAFCMYCGQRSLVDAETPRDFYRFEHGRAMACPACGELLQVRATAERPELAVAHLSLIHI